jgi:amino acid transporter
LGPTSRSKDSYRLRVADGTTESVVAADEPRLERGMGVMQAVASNMLVMIGVGPFLTLPLMVQAMGGPHIIHAWLLGAVLALCDGLVYAQLGAALPGTGGPYVYLREAFKPWGLGRPLAFLFIFQLTMTAPLTIASGAVGFADYLGFFLPNMTSLQHDLVAAALCVVMTALLYRNIESVGRLSLVMLAVVMLTIAWVLVSGLFHFSLKQAFDFPPRAFTVDRDLVTRAGAASVLAMYNYGGYNNVCNIGGELRDPNRTIPRTILASVLAVVAIYLLLTTVVLGTIPWQELQESRTLASIFVARTIRDPATSRLASIVMNGLILFVTASSLYGLILGYSRVPYAAAKDGQFFSVFGRVHPQKHFPNVSLIVIGAASIPFCFLSLGRLVTWGVLVQTLMQSVWLCAGVITLSTHRKDIRKPFRMWLFPLPALVALVMWLYIFSSAKGDGILFTFVFLAVGTAAYFAFSRRRAAASEQ